MPICRAEAQTEPHFAVFPDVVLIIQIAHGSLQLREKKRQCIGVIPHMGAGTFTATFVANHDLRSRKTIRPVAAGGRRFQDRNIGRNGVERGGRKAG